MEDREYLRLLGERIRKFRDAKEISQQELADHANIAKSTVQRIEKGQMNPTILVLLRLSEALSIHVLDLIK